MEQPRKPKLMIIYTGGTIGMIEDPGTKTLRPFDFNHLIDNVPKIKMLGISSSILRLTRPT